MATTLLAICRVGLVQPSGASSTIPLDKPKRGVRTAITENKRQDVPNGAALASFLAAGIGAFAVGSRDPQ
jgi:hypothetical protein